jgi:hypothetical protein
MNTRQLSRRVAISTALGAGAFLILVPIGTALNRLAGATTSTTPAMTFPSWVHASPGGLQAYRTAYANLDLMATLPCFCGCDRMDLAHTSLRDCYQRPDGSLERHGSVCGTCQGEAIDAARMAENGVPWPEIRTRIVAAYSNPGFLAR